MKKNMSLKGHMETGNMRKWLKEKKFTKGHKSKVIPVAINYIQKKMKEKCRKKKYKLQNA